MATYLSGTGDSRELSDLRRSTRHGNALFLVVRTVIKRFQTVQVQQQTVFELINQSAGSLKATKSFVLTTFACSSKAISSSAHRNASDIRSSGIEL